ncbi:Cna B-type domain-containing protein [Peptoniphilus catoniae]|uniref:Cna B-type domain-containing protein n=1 Tax=Peptoniphilus catoniae TaxID=1660341 RepID=UPI0010FD4E5E|nr:Cna B-type domain-containing protein [Peptoniphilus catoniae]
MKKRILFFLLALTMLTQTLMPTGLVFAAESKEKKDGDLVTIGVLNPDYYPKPEEFKQKDNSKTEALDGLEIGNEIVPQALRNSKSPYIDGQQPADPDKPKYWANVQGKLTTRGIDGTTFDWNKVLGQGAKVKLLFTQTNGNVMTGVTYTLLVDKDGTYTWQGSDGKPTYLPLYDVDGNPYTYNVQIQRNFSENVQLIIQESNGTPGVSWRPEGDKQVATIQFLDIGIQQLASTKFVSEWHTGLEEADRPQIEGYFKVDDKIDNDFNFPKNDTTRTILRSSFVENFAEDEHNGPWSFLSAELETTPQTVEVKTTTTGLTFEENNGVKTVKSGDHKFKYDFTYDVINGGKLTVTEVIPVTFDTNGGKFANFTAPDTETKIVKEVEYEGTLTDKAENPTKPGKAFKGWATDANGTTLATETEYANLTTAKTFYAIWSDEDIQAEELKTTESLGSFPKNKPPRFTNDFVPTFEDLKAQVKVKDANGNFGPLPETGLTFTIVDDKGTEYDKDSDDLKKFIYSKVKESKTDEVSRTETVKAKIKYSDGTEREIDIPIKVLKNIYKGTDEGNKYPHIPADYVKVTIDPTDKAQDPRKTYYYVNPKAKVIVPGKDPVGAGDNKFSKWTIKADSDTVEADYTFGKRQIYAEASTITAQYGTGTIKIIYVDNYGNEIDAKYHIAGQDYPSEKTGGLGREANYIDFASEGPDFKGYIYSSRDDIKGKYYKDPAEPDKLDTVKYSYLKRVTTKDPNNENAYFKVVFDANGGKFGANTQKTLWVYINTGDNPVTFEEARAEIESQYGLPTKDMAAFKEWQNKAADGSKVADDYVIKVPDWDWETYPDDGYTPEVFYATYIAEKMDFTATKVWDIPTGLTLTEDEYPTMKFTLWRAWTIGDAGEEQPGDEAVQGEEVGYVDGKNLEAVWKGLPKANSNGDLYTYYVKEEFKDSDIKNDNWITGTMPYEYISKAEYETKVAPTEGTITNTLKKPAEPGTNPDPDKNFVGKLTVKKVLENEPVPAMAMAKGPMKAPAAPIKFKFKVTGPYGYEETFEIEAGKEKELKDLAYGEYTVEEIETNNYTPKYVEGDYTPGTSTLSDEPIKVEVSKANDTKTVTVVNQNLEKPDSNFVTLEATKIWKNGPTTDHKQVSLNVFRQVEGGQKEEVQVEGNVKLKVTRDADDINKFNYTWTNLPKHNTEGKEYTYTVEEANIIEPTAPETDKTVKFGDNTYVVTQDGNTITNTYKVLKADVTATKVWSDGPEADHTQVSLNLFRQVEGGLKEQVSGLTPEVTPGAANTGTFNYTWKDLPTTDDNGKAYTYTVKEAGVVTDAQTNETTVTVNGNTYVVTVNNDTNTVTNTFKANTTTFTVNKVWADNVNDVPTMNLTLYRKVEGGTEEAVQGAEVKEITKTTTEATWDNLPKSDASGKAYEYSVKETFKDEDSDARNANWILGAMETDDSGNKTITNKLKTVPGDNDTPNEDEHRMGKLTITKKIESKPIAKSSSMHKAPAAPLEFTFKVTDPYGKEETFTLKAGESKELKSLLYGDYTIEETDAKGLTPFVKVGEDPENESNTGKVTLTKAAKEGTVTFTNKNVKPGENPNIIEVMATKVWVNGPATDHTAVALNLYRQVDGGQKEEVTDVTAVKTRDVDNASKFNYLWKDLPKINDEGKEYTYTVEEAGVVTDAQTNEKTATVNGNTYVVTQDGNTITNTYKVPQTDEDVIGTKVWQGVPAGTTTPTVKLELWRKTSDADQGVKVVDATDLDANNQANFGKQDKTDANGVEYTYFVKEVDENGNAFSHPKYTSVVDGLTATNTKMAEDGKLIITKKLENVPVRMMMRSPAGNADPIKFKFTVTKPDGTSEEFELAANGSKTLDNLPYGEYTIKETDTKGYTPFFTLGNEEKQTQEFKVTINSSDEVNVTVTNKNIINQNDLTVRATKIWIGGPMSDHTAVTLTLKRLSAKAGSIEEDVTNAYTAETINSTSDSITYVWKNLPKHDDEGYAYTYRVEELGTVSDPTSTDKIYTVGNNEYVSKVENDSDITANETTAFKITNTYKVPQTEEDIIATKVWQDVPAGTITPQVKFQLQRTANGVTEDVGQAMDLTNGQVNFGKQDKTDNNGNEYVYTVKELGEDGNAFSHPNYTSVVDGLTVTNTYQETPITEYTVTFDANGHGIAPEAQTVNVGQTAIEPSPAPTEDGYKFEGWYTDKDGLYRYNFATPVNSNITLYAKWIKEGTTPPTPDNPDNPWGPGPNPWDPGHNPWGPGPNPWGPSYPEKIVETKIETKYIEVPVKDNAYRKEVKYMQGFEGYFRPNDGLKRSEAAQILANALKEDGYKYDLSYKLNYKDIGDEWYTEAIKITTQANVFKGYDDGYFRPDDKISRAEWIATLKRFQSIANAEGNHMNMKSDHWAMAEVEAAYKEGWLSIYTDGLASFKADEFIPRQEVAAVSNKAFNRVLDKTYIEYNDKNLVTYKDVKKDMWSYYDILCASNTFLYKKDLYRAHWINGDNNLFNINTDGLVISKDKFQRVLR